MISGQPVPDPPSDVAENVTKEQVKAAITRHRQTLSDQVDELAKEERRKEFRELDCYIEREPWMDKSFSEMTEEEFDIASCYMAQEYYINTGRHFCEDLREADEQWAEEKEQKKKS